MIVSILSRHIIVRFISLRKSMNQSLSIECLYD